MTNQSQVTRSLHSLQILDIIESSPEHDGAIKDTREPKIPTYMKMAIAQAMGATTTDSKEYLEVDAIIKNQLYSRDMAGYTTSLIEPEMRMPAPPWYPDLKIPSVKREYEESMDAYRINVKMNKLRYFAMKTRNNRIEFMENLFHLKETSS